MEAQTYSLELPEWVVAAVEAAPPDRVVANIFLAKVISVLNWSQREQPAAAPRCAKGANVGLIQSRREGLAAGADRSKAAAS